MKNVYIIGSYQTKFKKWPEKSYKDLVRDAYMGVLGDLGWETGDEISSLWFGNVFMGNQQSIRGQVCTVPLVREGLLPERIPTVNVEGACASGGLAFYGAWQNIVTGEVDVSLAMGIEKLFMPEATKEESLRIFEMGLDTFDPQEWVEVYEKEAKGLGTEFVRGPNRSVFMDTYGLQATYHMKKYGTTLRQIAIAASKSHHNGTLNPKAQYQFEVPVEKVLEDYVVSGSLTRSMCAPIGDGAAAAVLCSEDYLKGLPSSVQNRAVKIKGIGRAGGIYRKLSEPSLTRPAGQRAYEMAGIGPEDIDLAEVHDAVAFSDIFEAEMLGFCDEGQGGRLTESGETRLEGRIPLNTSGGLVSKGHPIGATGLSMLWELVTQLRGEAGERQVKNPEFGLADNGGGSIGFDDACCIVTILQKDR